MSEVYLLCWDYGAVSSGEQASFSSGELHIKIKDAEDNEHRVALCASTVGNTVAIAKLEPSEKGVILHNLSSATTLTKLDFKDIAAICI